MLNKIMLMGRLTRDPELRKTQSDISVVSFCLAVDRDYRAKGAEKETDFINIVAWRGTADFVSKYFYKGQMAVVSGRLQSRQYEDKNGDKRTAYEVVADTVYFGEGKRDNSGNNSNYSSSPDVAPEYAPANDYPGGGYSNFSEFDDEDGDLPF